MLLVCSLLLLKKKIFLIIYSVFSAFIWDGKRARISMNKLCQDREKGGLGLPNLEKYYIAVNSRYPLWAYNYNMDIETRIGQ